MNKPCVLVIAFGLVIGFIGASLLPSARADIDLPIEIRNYSPQPLKLPIRNNSNESWKPLSTVIPQLTIHRFAMYAKDKAGCVGEMQISYPQQSYEITGITVVKSMC